MEHSVPVFDRATRLARSLFGNVGAEITLVSGDALWRSRVSANRGDGAGVREVMRTGELMWVEDARVDPRFRDDPTVNGPPYISFYCGAPIRLSDGTTPGALWVAGIEPRAYDRSLANRLQDLADFVADEWVRVEARRAQDDHQRTMAAMIDAMPVAMVLTDREARILYASPPWVRARGLEARQVVDRTLQELFPDMFEQ